MATADSNVNKRIWAMIRANKIKLEAAAVWLPRRVISKCPATMFAINRTANVKGRMTFLIVSIRTIKGIKAVGVLWGTKCANIWFVVFNHPNIIKANQKGALIANVRAICLDDVKMYGKSPIKLFIKINKNNEINITVLPENDVGPSSVLNSLCNFNLIIFIIILGLVGVFQ